LSKLFILFKAVKFFFDIISLYRADEFKRTNYGSIPATGPRGDLRNGKLVASKIGVIRLPELRENADWRLKLVYEEPEVKKP
jgi:hypothetical protein